MMFLGQGCSCSVPSVPKHREKEKLTKQRHCVCEGCMEERLTGCADLGKLLFPAGPGEDGVSWY